MKSASALFSPDERWSWTFTYLKAAFKQAAKIILTKRTRHRILDLTGFS
jgi:hypothetical protein